MAAEDPPSGTPADPDRDFAVVIGANLRRFRAQNDLSLERLSRIANVSRAMLGQIELGKSVPTITVLARIADAFELPVTAFMNRQAPTPVSVLRATDAKVLRSADGAFRTRALFPFQGSRRVEFYELTLGAGCVQHSEPHSAGDTENLVVIRGELEIAAGHECHRLGEGDAVFFAADVPHVYSNPGTVEAQAYLVMGYAEAISY